MRKRNPPKPKPRHPLPDYRNVGQGVRMLAEIIKESEERDKAHANTSPSKRADR